MVGIFSDAGARFVVFGQVPLEDDFTDTYIYCNAFARLFSLPGQRWYRISTARAATRFLFYFRCGRLRADARAT